MANLTPNTRILDESITLSLRLTNLQVITTIQFYLAILLPTPILLPSIYFSRSTKGNIVYALSLFKLLFKQNFPFFSLLFTYYRMRVYIDLYNIRVGVKCARFFHIAVILKLNHFDLNKFIHSSLATSV